MQASFFGRSAAVAALLALAFAIPQASALADEGADPGVARLSVLRGAVDLKRADSGDTFAATVNAPVSAGDYITTGDDAHAEIQYPFGASLRVASGTQLRFTRLDRDEHVAQLAAGTVELRLFRGLQSHPEVATPAATVRPTEDGRYRITVTSDGDSSITVRSGRADVITQAGTRTLTSGSTLSVTGTGDGTQLQSITQTAYDTFDRWNDERDADIERTSDFGYVDAGIVGADDLDRYGHWQDSSYGRAWRPDVNAGWAPYNEGRWTWQPYYGWTWVAAEPWGWAPYHYGRWFYASNGWCWSPGVVATWPVVYSAPVVFASPVFYQPALVAFFSFGSGFGGFGFGNLGWVPLAPFETFHPWWGSRLANRTTINNVTNITNITNVTNINTSVGSNPGGSIAKMYRNAAAPGGAVAVRTDNFTTGHFEHVVALHSGELTKVSPIRGILPVVPTAKNLAYSNAAPAAVSRRLESRFAAFAPPKIVTLPFTQQQAEIKQLTLKAYPKSNAALEGRPAAPKPEPVPAPANSRHPLGASHALDGGHIERIEGSTLQTTSVTPNRTPRSVASPWDRFEDARTTRTRTAGTLEVLPGNRSGTVPVTTSDPFSRFGDGGYDRPARKQPVTSAPRRNRSYGSVQSERVRAPSDPPTRSHAENGEPAYRTGRPPASYHVPAEMPSGPSTREVSPQHAVPQTLSLPGRSR